MRVNLKLSTGIYSRKIFYQDRTHQPGVRKKKIPVQITHRDSNLFIKGFLKYYFGRDGAIRMRRI
jgi:hypothetical protein